MQTAHTRSGIYDVVSSDSRRKILIILNVSRPVLWITLPLVFCLGLAYGQHGLADPAFRFTPLMIIQLFMLSFPICLFTFGINDVHDYESDRINPRKNGIEGMCLPVEHRRVVMTSALAAGFLFLIVSLITLDRLNIFFTVTILVLSYAYSTPPWRLKTRPPLDAISAGVFGFLAPFALGYGFVDDALSLPFHAYLFTLCVAGFQTFSTIMDYDADKKTGDGTFAVVCGKRAAALLPVFVFFFSFFFIHVSYVKAFFLFCLCLFILVTIVPSEKLARYSFLGMFALAVIMAGIWVISVMIN